ncbi:MAG: ORF6N domain-containing protein [Candidatus Omnitrophica bacterium]|nr:ORF6N domain-containing protein [Candidatus Omnitrophota bacterium]
MYKKSLSALQERIETKILFIRGARVMLDRDLAKIYRVETKQLKRAVRRNVGRFPEDFMFELSRDEYRSLRCQFGTLKIGEHSKYLPYAFTQEGVAMLSSVLHSERAIQANIQIMRAFVKLREFMATHENLKKKIEEMEKKYDYQFKIVFDAIKQLLESPKQEPKKRIGFHL